jgi:two-component system, OmpR family, heavy metal sensor histidine kinase CusS
MCFVSLLGGKAEPASDAEKAIASRDPRGRNRLHWVYFALAAFDIITISSSLYLNHRIMGAYEQAVHTSRDWAGRVHEITIMGELAQQVNAPGNDVFDTGDVRSERARRDSALSQFNAQWAKIDAELDRNISAAERAPIESALTSTKESMADMTAQADLIFAEIGHGRASVAGRRMATMDRVYARLTRGVSSAVIAVQAAQLRHLQRQVEISQQLRRLEYVFGGLILIIVISVAVYGHQIGQLIRRNEDELAKAYAALQQYADNVAHELRSPVNKMLVGSEVTLSRDRTSEEYQEALQSNMEECQRLSSIVEGILFLANADNTRIDLMRQRIDVARELRLIVDYFEASAQEAKVALSLEVDAALEGAVDRVLFQRAVSNLVSNAISHTPPGGEVVVRGRRVEGAFEVEVADTGEGIAEQAQTHVFDRFYRADQVRTATSGRLGLGLPITKSIVELHKGRIALDSQLGRGTKIGLTFPAASPVMARAT